MKKMNKTAVKYIVCSLLGALIIIYFIIQIVTMNSSPYTTELAIERNIQNTIETTAFAVRDEAYITAQNSGGTVVAVAEDGKRVGSGETVAVVFANSESAAVYVRINELEKEIEYCRQLQNRVGLGTNAPSSYNDMIDDAWIAFIEAARNGISSEFDETLNDLRDAVTTRQLAVGEELSVDEKLASLEAEFASLRDSAANYETVLSPHSGYYIGAVDGYEDALDYGDVLNVNCEKINELLSYQKKDSSGSYMGKLVDEFNWYLLCNVPYNESGELSEGDTVSVNVLNTSVSTLKCTVEMKGNKEGDSVAVVLKCNTMNRNTANLRIEEIEIVTDEYTGFRINNKAIREQDGEKGVFVIRGNIVQFRKIDIVSSTEEFSIVKVEDDSSYLQQYDTIITEGVDLYDGKVIS